MSDGQNILNSFSSEELEKIKVLAGLFGIGQQADTKKSVDVEQGFSEYNKLIEFNQMKKSIDAAKTAQRRFLLYIPGNRALSTIDRKDAESLMMKIAKSAPLGCYNYLKVFRTMFNVFLDWGYVSVNPFLKVKLPKRQKEEPVYFTDEQISAVCERLEVRGKQVIADMVKFAVETGLRLDEENSLRWSDVDYKNRVLIIGSKNFSTKNKKVRRIPFNDKVEEILKRNACRQIGKGNPPLYPLQGGERANEKSEEEISPFGRDDRKTERQPTPTPEAGKLLVPLPRGEKTEKFEEEISPFGRDDKSTEMVHTPIFSLRGGERNGFVFVQDNGKQYKKDTVSKWLKKVVKECGLPDELHWHCLRATAATRWASNKVPIFTVAKLLGHSSVNVTTRFYAGLDLEELREAVNRM